ncbi:MAG: hypothetical protein ACJ8EB_05495 [Allosphingosinicella sp.]
MSQKRENFVRLAEARVNRALREFRLIGNLSNRGAYTYSDSDVRSMFKALQRELDTQKARFTGDGGTADKEFRLAGDA